MGKCKKSFMIGNFSLVSFTNKMNILFIILYYFFKTYCATQAESESKC